jgi:hypothetical protein
VERRSPAKLVRAPARASRRPGPVAPFAPSPATTCRPAQSNALDRSCRASRLCPQWLGRTGGARGKLRRADTSPQTLPQIPPRIPSSEHAPRRLQVHSAISVAVQAFPLLIRDAPDTIRTCDRLLRRRQEAFASSNHHLLFPCVSAYSGDRSDSGFASFRRVCFPEAFPGSRVPRSQRVVRCRYVVPNARR